MYKYYYTKSENVWGHQIEKIIEDFGGREKVKDFAIRTRTAADFRGIGEITISFFMNNPFIKEASPLNYAIVYTGIDGGLDIRCLDKKGE